MSFKRFLQHDMLRRVDNGHEIIRLLITVSKNILENPWIEAYNRIRIVKITSLTKEDTAIFEEVLIRMGFIKSIENGESIFRLTKFELLTRFKLDDLISVFSEQKPKEKSKDALNLVHKYVDRSELQTRLNNKYVKLVQRQV